MFWSLCSLQHSSFILFVTIFSGSSGNVQETLYLLQNICGISFTPLSSTEKKKPDVRCFRTKLGSFYLSYFDKISLKNLKYFWYYWFKNQKGSLNKCQKYCCTISPLQRLQVYLKQSTFSSYFGLLKCNG